MSNCGHNGGPALSPLEVGAPLPASIGRCADLYHDMRELRLSMEKEAAKVKARETEIREHIILHLSASQDTGAAGLKYRAQIVSKTVPRVDTENDGWANLWAHIAQTGEFDLLQKRLGEGAVAERWERGETIPGVEAMKVKDVSITKI